MDVLDLDDSPVRFRGSDLSLHNTDRNAFPPAHLLDVHAPELHLGALARLHCGDPEDVPDTEGRRLAGPEPPPPRNSSLAVEILAVHLEEVGEPIEIHAAPVVVHSDSFGLAVQGDDDARLRPGV